MKLHPLQRILSAPRRERPATKEVLRYRNRLSVRAPAVCLQPTGIIASALCPYPWALAHLSPGQYAPAAWVAAPRGFATPACRGFAPPWALPCSAAGLHPTAPSPLRRARPHCLPPAFADRVHCPHPALRSLAGQTLAAAVAPSAERRAAQGSLSFPPRHRGCDGDRLCCCGGGAGPKTPAASSGLGGRPRADFGGTPTLLEGAVKERGPRAEARAHVRGCHRRRGHFRSQPTTRCLSAPFTPRPSPHLSPSSPRHPSHHIHIHIRLHSQSGEHTGQRWQATK